MNLKPAAVTRFLAVVVTSLAALSIAGQFAYYVLGLKGTIAKKLFALFYADWEYNLRSWYSASALLACALLLVLIAATRRRRGDRFALHWSALALLFFGLSLDEAIGLHERLNDFVGRHVDTSGAFYSSWVIPRAIFVLGVAFAYLRFLRHFRLPRGVGS